MENPTQNTDRIFYVYVDWTTDETACPFYVGKGVESRIKVINRNQKHKHIRMLHGFCRKIIFETKDEQLALNREMELISELDTYNPDHKDFSDFRANKTRGGDGTVGLKFSDESKALLRYLRRKFYNSHKSDGLKEQISNSVKNVWADPKMREKYIKAAINKPPMSDKTKRKLSEKSKGHIVSEETKQKISSRLRARAEAIRNGQAPPIVIPAKKTKKRKLLDPMEGIIPEHLNYITNFEQNKLNSSDKNHSPEANKARSETMRRNWADPELRQQYLEARKNSYNTPEFKEKISKIGKQNWAESTEEYKEKQRANLKRARDIRYGRETK